MLKNVREIFLSLEASIREGLFFNSLKAHCQDISSLPAASAQRMQGLQAQTQVTKFKRIIWDPQNTAWGIVGNPLCTSQTQSGKLKVQTGGSTSNHK